MRGSVMARSTMPIGLICDAVPVLSDAPLRRGPRDDRHATPLTVEDAWPHEAPSHPRRLGTLVSPRGVTRVLAAARRARAVRALHVPSRPQRRKRPPHGCITWGTRVTPPFPHPRRAPRHLGRDGDATDVEFRALR